MIKGGWSVSECLIVRHFHPVWTTCNYVSRDGQFNPDGRLINNVGDFQDFAEATFYNALAWVLETSSDRDTYEANAG